MGFRAVETTGGGPGFNKMGMGSARGDTESGPEGGESSAVGLGRWVLP